MKDCPTAIKVEWTQQPPDLMEENIDYPTAWKIVVGDGYAIRNDGTDIPHANIHSCLRNGGACTPFVANTPGLSTHTPAIKANLTEVTTGDLGSEVEFETMVNLITQQYTIIAHTRFFIDNPKNASLAATKYDVAIGIVRDVIPQEVRSSASAIVTAAVVGAVLLIVLTITILAVRTGKFDFEAFLTMLLNEKVLIMVGLVIGVGDVISFTLSTIHVARYGNAEIINVLPLMILFCVTGWMVSVTKGTRDAITLLTLIKTESSSEAAAEHAAKIAAASFKIKKNNKDQVVKGLQTSMTRKISENTDSVTIAMNKLTQAQRRIGKIYFTIVALLLEACPLMGITIFILINSSEVVITDCLCLFFASVVMGNGFTNIAGFKVAKKQKYDALSDLADVLEDEQFNAIVKTLNQKEKKIYKVTPVAPAP